MSERRVFGELELSIMKMFEGYGKLTVRDVLDSLGSDDKYTTIMTVMNRLVDKGLLARSRNGQQYEYWIPKSNKTPAPTLLGRLKNGIFGGNSASMASYLIEKGDITDAELARLEKLVRDIRQSRKRS